MYAFKLFLQSHPYSFQPIHFTVAVLYLLLQVYAFYFAITFNILVKN